MNPLASVLGAVFAIVTPLQSARAQIVLSQHVSELQSGKKSREDIEILNEGSERAYVIVEPRQIINPGTDDEKTVTDRDPGNLGLLVSPVRLVLEPGQHKLVRFADIGPGIGPERVYRITVRPVIGGLEAEQSGIKILVGYDVLVLVRPTQPSVKVSAIRTRKKLVWRNEGDVSVELTGGRQCSLNTTDCVTLPGKRLYAGATWTVDLPRIDAVDYAVRSVAGTSHRRFEIAPD